MVDGKLSKDKSFLPKPRFSISCYKDYISFFFLFSVYDEGGVKLRNPNIELMDQDILYHLALGNESHDLVEMFGDIKVSWLIKENTKKTHRDVGDNKNNVGFIYHFLACI